MATIHSLPAEILCQIFKLEPPWPTHLAERPTASYEVLRCASLVSRSWTAAAQDRLWRRVVLVGSFRAEAFTRNGATGRTTTELNLNGYDDDGWSPPSSFSGMAGVIDACSGLRTVRFYAIPTYRDMLWSPKMAEDPSLSAIGDYDDYGGDVPSSPLPFQLTRLELSIPPDPPFLDLLLQPTITSLFLDPTFIKPSHAPSLVKIAPQLAILDLAAWLDVDDLAPLFPASHLLSLLSCDIASALFILPVLPASLEELHLEGEYEGRTEAREVDRLSEILRSNTVALSGLRRLVIDGAEKSRQETKCVRELLALCQSRRIVLENLEDFESEEGSDED